jgi:hypothetical protein
VQAGEAASAAAIAGGHVDGHSLAADLDRLLGAGIFTQQAVVALTAWQLASILTRVCT